MSVSLLLTNGLTFGVEHLSSQEDADVAYMIVIHLLMFKVCLVKFK